ncbi:Beta-galactosidase [Cucumis melo var. makuwa]|uniref:Beta-galactosidase n=1 Tax=Cucumis melo var. makuwa TaxID=1194695 RepID=A0A5D3DIW2_CUCMM|nr:Beta-galactosidase [Cucumis melo var. makuwa]TYK23533.1 Beta-galactosidase [Cucumis melo var. makuwa]
MPGSALSWMSGSGIFKTHWPAFLPSCNRPATSSLQPHRSLMRRQSGFPHMRHLALMHCRPRDVRRLSVNWVISLSNLKEKSSKNQDLPPTGLAINHSGYLEGPSPSIAQHQPNMLQQQIEEGEATLRAPSKNCSTSPVYCENLVTSLPALSSSYVSNPVAQSKGCFLGEKLNGETPSPGDPQERYWKGTFGIRLNNCIPRIKMLLIYTLYKNKSMNADRRQWMRHPSLTGFPLSGRKWTYAEKLSGIVTVMACNILGSRRFALRKDHTRAMSSLTNPAIDSVAFSARFPSHDSEKHSGKPIPAYEHYKKQWHTKEQCWKLHGCPPGGAVLILFSVLPIVGCHKFKKVRENFLSEYGPKVNGKISCSQHPAFSSDVWGPSKVTTSYGKRWVVTFIDDHTCLTWVFLISDKSEVTSTFRNFYHIIKTQFNVKIAILYSDNDRKFQNHTLNEFLSSKGVVHQSSCAYTPQQNGVAERKSRHLLEVSRSLMLSTSLPSYLGDDVVLIAAHLISSTKCLPNDSLEMNSTNAHTDTKVGGNDKFANNGLKQLSLKIWLRRVVLMRSLQIERSELMRMRLLQNLLKTKPSKIILETSKPPTQFRAFTVNLDSTTIPKNIHLALECPKWKTAIMEEMRALEKNKT